jgi:hypothetical protein
MQLTPRSAAVMANAKEWCRRGGLGDTLSSVHLIIGLLRLNQGVAVSILQHNGATIKAVEEFISGSPCPPRTI